MPKFSDERIRALSKKMAAEMIDSGAVEAKGGLTNLSTLIAQALIQDQKMGEKIEEEAREKLLSYPRLPPEGSGEYEAMYRKALEEVAARRGYPL